MNKLFRPLLAFLLLVTSPSLFSSSASMDVVHLQLRWNHQFQFAGYYAALEKGFYQQAGLDVQIQAGAPGTTPVEQVLNGSAQYGVANSELLYQRLLGKPLVALAAVFQHSPSVLLARQDAQINSLHDLIDRKIMLMGNVTDADFHAMFQKENIALSQLNILPSSYDIDDLVTGRVDAFNSYLTNEPFYLTQRHIDVTVINPRSYGVDFYSDILFTTEDELKRDPERVNAFRSATLRGWEYAMNHPDEIIDLLINRYGVKKSREHLKYECETMRKLIFPDLVELGHMNPGRWQHMANTFVEVGMVSPGYDLSGFIYDPQQRRNAYLQKVTSTAVAIAVVLLIALILFIIMYRRIRKEVQLRATAEEKIKQMAFYDSLTSLPNRNLFYDRFNQAILSSKRSNAMFALCFIDLDGFKSVNDKHGHIIGDEILTQVGQRLQCCIRKSDTVARFGGDEFVVLMHGVHNRQEIEKRVTELHETIKQPYSEAEGKIVISSSIGIAVFPDDKETAADLLHIADSAMYASKKAGKDQFVFFRDLKPKHA